MSLVRDAFLEVRAVAESAKTSGYSRQADGTVNYGRLPQIGTLAWLHTVFGPLAPEEIELLEERLDRPVPSQYREFLGYANGVNLFADSLSLDGLVLLYDRTSDDRQPYDIATPNLFERPPDAGEHDFFIGGYSWDGSLLYLDQDGQVKRCSEASADPRRTWSDLPEMPNAELERISHLMERSGGPAALTMMGSLGV